MTSQTPNSWNLIRPNTTICVWQTESTLNDSEQQQFVFYLYYNTEVWSTTTKLRYLLRRDLFSFFQHDVSILGSVNFCETFSELISEVLEKADLPRDKIMIFFLYVILNRNLLTLSTEWSNLFFTAWYWNDLLHLSRDYVTNPNWQIRFEQLHFYARDTKTFLHLILKNAMIYWIKCFLISRKIYNSYM